MKFISTVHKIWKKQNAIKFHFPWNNELFFFEKLFFIHYIDETDVTMALRNKLYDTQIKDVATYVRFLVDTFCKDFCKYYCNENYVQKRIKRIFSYSFNIEFFYKNQWVTRCAYLYSGLIFRNKETTQVFLKIKVISPSFVSPIPKHIIVFGIQQNTIY